MLDMQRIVDWAFVYVAVAAGTAMLAVAVAFFYSLATGTLK